MVGAGDEPGGRRSAQPDRTVAKDALTYEDLLKIVELVKSSPQFSEFRLKVGEIELHLRRKREGGPAPESTEAIAAAGTAVSEARPDAHAGERAWPEHWSVVRSPMVGAVFDVCVRYLHENPWERVGLLCDRLATPCDALTRGQSLYTFELFPDDVVALNAQALARRGVAVLTVYDALNDNRNIESSVRAARAAGMKINTWMTYTLSPVHTDGYYVERTRELVALGADFICIKDPTGLLTPERGRTLFPAVVQAAGEIPLQLHSHCQSGLAPEVYTVAMQSGFRFGYTASEPLANGASLPATEDIGARALGLGYQTGL